MPSSRSEPRSHPSGESTGTKRSGQRLSRAARYWDGVLDPRNLETHRGRQAASIELNEELRFVQTPDFAAAEAWLRRAPAGDGRVCDLGAGLGPHTMAMALRGWRVISVDTSLNRLRALGVRAHQAGCLNRVMPVVAQAEALPFRPGALGGVYTKSVLIHTRLPEAAEELRRVTRSGGRAALIEPQPGNPLAWLYRRSLAPRSWRQITRYFGRRERAMFLAGWSGPDGRGRVEPYYLISFLAFVFHFGWPCPWLFRLVLNGLNRLERPMLRWVPGLNRLAWFGLILLEKPEIPRDAPPA